MKRTFMGFIYHYHRVLCEERVHHHFAHERAVREEVYAREPGRGDVLEADGVPDIAPQLDAHLLRDTPGDSRHRHAPRLCAADHPRAPSRPARLVQVLGYLRCFPAPCLTHNHHHRIRFDSVKNFIFYYNNMGQTLVMK